jgi:DNA-nicking Smr family endonuclease
MSPISDEDKALFRNAVYALARPHKKKASALAPEEPLYLSDYYTQTVETNTILSYYQTPLPFKQKQQHKLGQIRWQARLDLHRMNIDTARSALCAFILSEYRQEHHCILIIHGKGSHQGEPPILKNHVNHWLKQIPHVLAFHSAMPRDGGAGAIYVLLKKHRDET